MISYERKRLRQCAETGLPDNASRGALFHATSVLYTSCPIFQNLPDVPLLPVTPFVNLLLQVDPSKKEFISKCICKGLPFRDTCKGGRGEVSSLSGSCDPVRVQLTWATPEAEPFQPANKLVAASTLRTQAVIITAGAFAVVRFVPQQTISDHQRLVSSGRDGLLNIGFSSPAQEVGRK